MHWLPSRHPFPSFPLQPYSKVSSHRDYIGVNPLEFQPGALIGLGQLVLLSDHSHVARVGDSHQIGLRHFFFFGNICYFMINRKHCSPGHIDNGNHIKCPGKQLPNKI